MAEADQKGSMGAPTKLDRPLIRKIENLLRFGSYVETAAAACGVNKTTLYRWLKRGAKAKRGLYSELCNAVDRAMAEAELRDLSVIDQAAQGSKKAYYLTDPDGNKIFDKDGLPRIVPPLRSDWRAAAWRLEKRNPKRWGARQTLQHVGPDGGSGISLVLSEETPAQKEARKQRIAEKLARLKSLDE